MSIVPPNFTDLVKNVIPVPNFMWRIAANTCSIKPFLFVHTLLPATLFLFTRIFIFDLDDLIVDNARRAAHNVARSKPTKGRLGRTNLGPRQKPNRAAQAVRFLFFPINVVERVGFTWLLASFADDLSIAWTSVISRCDECSDSGSSIENGPMVREMVPGTQFLTNGWAGIPMPILLQNRAGWTSTLQSVGLPQGDWTVVLGATIRSSNATTLPFQARLRVNMTVAGFPVEFTEDFFETEAIQGQAFDILLSATLHVPPTISATITWEWQTLSVGLPIFTRIDGDLFVTGKNTCVS